MSIRLRLLTVFAIFFVVVLVIGSASVWTMIKWQAAADNLYLFREQEQRAERLRATVTSQIDYGLGFLSGDENPKAEISALQPGIDTLLTNLKASAQDNLENDHIEGFEETLYELSWILAGILSQKENKLDRVVSRRRLQEIAEEVTSDIAALNQYYNVQVNLGIGSAVQAGSRTTYLIIGAVLAAFLHLLAVGIFVRKWLTQPIAKISRGTNEISKGNLEIRIEHDTDDELGKLAESVNYMAQSLKTIQAQLRAQERFATLGELGAYTAHNIRNPLASIRAAAQVSVNDGTVKVTELKETFADIIKVVDRLELWIKGFLTFAKPLELKGTATDINELLKETVEMLVMNTGGVQIEVATELSDDLPLIEIDPILMEQALMVFLTNACEAGCRTIGIKTCLKRNRDHDLQVRIEITDDGKGIPENVKVRLFQVFVSDKTGGTGLGLAQAKKIVDLHGGQLTLESTKGRGTTALISLPVRQTENVNSID